MHGHGAHDDARYVDPGLLASWAEHDPIGLYRKMLGHEVDGEALQAAVEAEIEQAVAEALGAPMANAEHVLEGVFCNGDPEPLGVGESRWSGFTGS